MSDTPALKHLRSRKWLVESQVRAVSARLSRKRGEVLGLEVELKEVEDELADLDRAIAALSYPDE